MKFFGFLIGCGNSYPEFGSHHHKLNHIPFLRHILKIYKYTKHPLINMPQMNIPADQPDHNKFKILATDRGLKIKQFFHDIVEILWKESGKK
jgi:hypothetical protein